MTAPNSTPGPWVLVENSWDVTTVYAPGGETVAECPINGMVDEETQDAFQSAMVANAHLIAAAPELYEICERILDRGYVSSGIEEERVDHAALASALAKARGETA